MDYRFVTFFFFLLGAFSLSANEIKVGIIGLDTSHSIAFAKAMNSPSATGNLVHCKVVAAYPYGSKDIESSTSRIPKYTEEISLMGIEIMPSIPALLEKVDAVLLETNDGRPHLEQVRPVLQAGKRVFIDKPISASLADAILIFETAKTQKIPIFSSSSLRFAKSTQAAGCGTHGKIIHCETSSPAGLEKSHPDLFWYGIHGVESLFTVMGPGCQSVKRSTTEDGKIVVEGKWSNGRTGVFKEDKGYQGTATNEKGETFPVGNSEGYGQLVIEIANYFVTGEIPVTPEVTLEIYAFMEAADESKRQNGAEIKLKSVMTTEKN